MLLLSVSDSDGALEKVIESVAMSVRDIDGVRVNVISLDEE